MEQNYLIIENNVVTNNVIWDGGSDWIPPTDSIQLVQSTTLAKIWKLNSDKTAWVLTEVLGAGDISFTWDGTILTTNEPSPTSVPTQPKTTGTQSA